ncbi:hypothetical protein BLOT_003378, partial [Blomia tropicalis]
QKLSSLYGLNSTFKSATENIDITGNRDDTTICFKGSIILNLDENSTKSGDWNMGHHNEHRQKQEKMVDDHKS